MPTQQHLLEYQTLREKAGYFRDDFNAGFEISGKDAVPYLQGMVSNDVQSLKPGQGCYAACLTAVGKMISDLWVYRYEEGVFVILPKSQKKKIMDHLDQFVFIEEVSFKDLEEETDLFFLQGPLSGKLIEEVTGEKIMWAPNSHRSFLWKGVPIRMVHISTTGEEGFGLLIPKHATTGFLQELVKKGDSYGLRQIGPETVEVLRIEAGLPRFGIDMNESTIPLEAGLSHAVSYTKGCYVGQEVIARATHIGHVNKALTGLKVEGPASAGDKMIENGNEIGHLTSACYSPVLASFAALATVRRESSKPGTPVDIHTSYGVQKAQVIPLPFYARS